MSDEMVQEKTELADAATPEVEATEQPTAAPEVESPASAAASAPAAQEPASTPAAPPPAEDDDDAFARAMEALGATKSL